MTQSMTQQKIKLPNNRLSTHRATLKACESFFYSTSIEDFLSLLYKEINKRTKIKTLILYYPSIYFGPIQYVCHSQGVFKRPTKEYKTNDTKTTVYLANFLGRPVHHIQQFVISLQDTTLPAFLFLEWNTKQTDKGLHFYHSFSNLIESSVNRLLRKEHLQNSINLWTTSFNSLKEPLAVFDEQNNLQSANTIFYTLFASSIIEEHFQWKDRFFEKNSYPVSIKGEQYTIYHYVDITESLNLRNKMIQTLRMSALGQLGTNVAHQLNNPLTGILSMAQLMLKSGNLNKAEQKDMQDIVRGVSRSQEIIANLLDFSRIKSQLTISDLNIAVKKTMLFLKSLVCLANLKLELYPSPLLVKTQTCLLQQVVFNLVKNACQAVENLDPSYRQILVRSHTKNKQAFLYVEDSGQGISPSDYKSIFKPFWTTKKEKGGTGLGLNISYDIVQSFKGNLTVSPSSLGGACFVLSLPLLDSKGDHL